MISNLGSLVGSKAFATRFQSRAEASHLKLLIGRIARTAYGYAGNGE